MGRGSGRKVDESAMAMENLGGGLGLGCGLVYLGWVWVPDDADVTSSLVATITVAQPLGVCVSYKSFTTFFLRVKNIYYLRAHVTCTQHIIKKIYKQRLCNDFCSSLVSDVFHCS